MLFTTCFSVILINFAYYFSDRMITYLRVDCFQNIIVCRKVRVAIWWIG